MQISFQAKIPKAIPQKYLTKESKDNTVAIMGSSKKTDKILEYMDICANSTRAIVKSGKNIVHGCGNAGIMGEAYVAGEINSIKDNHGTPVQNLAIIANPLWGDEDLDNCVPLLSSNSEAERIEGFSKVANTFVIYPGSATTLQEVTTLIAKNYYGKKENKKKIILVGSEFFKGLKEQYDELYRSKLISCPPSELFTIVDSEEEIEANLI